MPIYGASTEKASVLGRNSFSFNGTQLISEVIDSDNIFILDDKKSLRLASPNGTAFENVDANVDAFYAVDAKNVYVRGTDQKLWLESGPFGTVPPPREGMPADAGDLFIKHAMPMWRKTGPAFLWSRMRKTRSCA